MASQTIWVNAPDIEEQSWLLKDGSIVTTPPIERTVTNKRIRIKGTTVSMGIRQLDALYSAGLDQVAQLRNTELWMRLWTDSQIDQYAAQAHSAKHGVWKSPLSLHLLEEDTSGYGRGRTTVVWKFKARHLPLHAYVWVDLVSGYQGRAEVETKVQYRSTHPRDNLLGSDPMWLGFEDNAFDRPAYGIPYYGPETERLQKHLTDVGTPFSTILDAADRPKIEERGFGNGLRRAATYLAQQCVKINEISSIELPDLRDPDAPSWMTFDFVSTNYHGGFAQEVTDFIQTGPIMDRIKGHYEAILNDLQLLGVVIPNRPEASEYERAAQGDFVAVDVTVPPLADAEQQDNTHKVFLNFLSGTITVSCHSPHDPDAAAAWEIDKFKYEATGQMSEFLAYARAFNDKADRKKAKEISDARVFDPSILTDD